MKKLIKFLSIEIVVTGLSYLLISFFAASFSSKEPFVAVGGYFAGVIGTILGVLAIAAAWNFYDEVTDNGD